MTDTSSLRDRIQTKLDELGLSARAASLKAGLNTHFLQGILSDEARSMTTDNLFRLAEALDTSPEWLLTGRGPEEFAPGAQELLDNYLRLSESDRRSLLDYVRWQLSKPD